MKNIETLKMLREQLAILEDTQANNPPKDKLNFDQNVYQIKRLRKKIAELELELGILGEQTGMSSAAVSDAEGLASDISNQLDLVVDYPQIGNKRKKKLKSMLRDLHSKKAKLATEHSVKEATVVANTHPLAELFDNDTLTLMELEKIIYEYFMDNFGVPITLQRDRFAYKVVLPDYADRTEEDIEKLSKYDNIAKDLTKLIKDMCNLSINLNPATYGYNLYFNHKDGAPILNSEIPEELRLESTLTEVTKQDITTEVSDSNLILDNKFIWVFTVLDKYSETIVDNIFNLDDALSAFVDNEPAAVMLVAYPYIDPNPEDLAVDLVFADNPGPVIVFNNDKATKPKEDLEDELAEDELEDIEQERESLDKEQLEESYKKLTEKEDTLQLVKYLKTTYDKYIDEPNYKREKVDENNNLVKDRQGRQLYVTHLDDLKDEIGVIVKTGRMPRVLQAVVDLAKVAEDKLVKKYLVDFGKLLNQLSKQARVTPEAVEGSDDLDTLARRAGLIESRQADTATTEVNLRALIMDQLVDELNIKRPQDNLVFKAIRILKQTLKFSDDEYWKYLADDINLSNFDNTITIYVQDLNELTDEAFYAAKQAYEELQGTKIAKSAKYAKRSSKIGGSAIKTEATQAKLDSMTLDQLKKALYAKRKKHTELMNTLNNLKQKDRTNDKLKSIYDRLMKYDKEAEIIFNEILERGKQDV